MLRSILPPNSVLPPVRVLVWGLCIFVGVPGSLGADTIRLTNGSTIDGTVVSEDGTVVVLKVGSYGTLRIDKARIVDIEKNLRTGNRPAKPAPQRKSPDQRKPGESKPADAKPDPVSMKLSPSLKSRLESPVVPFVGSERDQVEAWVADLQRQRANYRTRAERHLSAKGVRIVPHLQKVAKSSFVRARICALRLLNKFPRYQSMPAALSGLQAEDPWVRKLASELAGKISGKPQSYPWQAEEDRPRRERKKVVWEKWYQQQEALRQLLEQRCEDEAGTRQGP